MVISKRLPGLTRVAGKVSKMDFTPNNLENSRVNFNDLLLKLTPSEQFHLYQFLITLLEYLLEREARP